jgi:hypothetical protein
MIDEHDRSTVPFEELEHRAAVAEQKAKDAKKNLQATFATIASAALDALAARARVVFFVVLMASLFAYSMIEPSFLRVGAATLFGLLLILAGLFKEKKDD